MRMCYTVTHYFSVIFDPIFIAEYKDCAQDCERQVANIRLEM